MAGALRGSILRRAAAQSLSAETRKREPAWTRTTAQGVWCGVESEWSRAGKAVCGAPGRSESRRTVGVSAREKQPSHTRCKRRVCTEEDSTRDEEHSRKHEAAHLNVRRSLHTGPRGAGHAVRGPCRRQAPFCLRDLSYSTVSLIKDHVVSESSNCTCCVPMTDRTAPHPEPVATLGASRWVLPDGPALHPTTHTTCGMLSHARGYPRPMRQSYVLAC